jgi:hypothetical protein
MAGRAEQRYSKARQAGLGKARHGGAWPGKAWKGKAGKSGLGKARQGKASPGKAGLARVEQSCKPLTSYTKGVSK